MSAENPLSPKTVMATTGAGGGTVIAALVNWFIGVAFYGIPNTADKAADAVAAVPAPLASAIALLTPVIGAALLGWRTNDPLRVTPDELKQLRG